MSKKKWILTGAAGLLLIAAVAAVVLVRMIPQTRVVPDDYATIGEAMAAARAGDMIYVKEGVYEEQVALVDGVKLVGQHRDNTIIQSDTAADQVIMVRQCGSGLISGLTVKHLAERDISPVIVAIRVDCSVVEIEDCRVSSVSGSGMLITHASRPNVHDCIAESNPSNGIVIAEHSCPTLERNICRDNTFNGIYFAIRGHWNGYRQSV